jgi:SpoVK/Ycf46/Vps4 family AAA+-type ATPase
MGEIRELIFGGPGTRALINTVRPRRTLDDVVLPADTLNALQHALALIRKHDLILNDWGLGERHQAGMGLAFHFAGPPGTGKTICAEALASYLGRELMTVRYAEIESRWVGQTSKHLSSVFREAARKNAVLFFDEADAIAGRRFASATTGYEREANTVVNVLLQELDRYTGVVIFATNLAVGIDPAFERRIRTHILFRLPGQEERARIWRAQLHARTPLAKDVDFDALAAKYARSGGDIKNAVLKAAQLAAFEAGPDHAKRIHQRHFDQGMTEVIAAGEVMSQSLFDEPAGATDALISPLLPIAQEQHRLAERLAAQDTRLAATEARQQAWDGTVRHSLRTMTWLAGSALAASVAALAIALLR